MVCCSYITMASHTKKSGLFAIKLLKTGIKSIGKCPDVFAIVFAVVIILSVGAQRLKEHFEIIQLQKAVDEMVENVRSVYENTDLILSAVSLKDKGLIPEYLLRNFKPNDRMSFEYNVRTLGILANSCLSEVVIDDEKNEDDNGEKNSDEQKEKSCSKYINIRLSGLTKQECIALTKQFKEKANYLSVSGQGLPWNESRKKPHLDINNYNHHLKTYWGKWIYPNSAYYDSGDFRGFSIASDIAISIGCGCPIGEENCSVMMVF